MFWFWWRLYLDAHTEQDFILIVDGATRYAAGSFTLSIFAGCP